MRRKKIIRKTRVYKHVKIKCDKISVISTVKQNIFKQNTYNKDKKRNVVLQKRLTHSLIFRAMLHYSRARLLNKKKDRTVCISFYTLPSSCTHAI